jgi:hypothetical protein
MNWEAINAYRISKKFAKYPCGTQKRWMYNKLCNYVVSTAAII